MAEPGQPAAQHPMHALGTHYRPLGVRQRDWEEDERERLAPAHPAVGAVREPVGAAHVGCSVVGALSAERDGAAVL
jgi:hypothetical protein